MMHENTLNVPGLFIFSKVDPVSDESVNMPVVRKWEKNGQIFVHIFLKSFLLNFSYFVAFLTLNKIDLTRWKCLRGDISVYTKCFADSPHVSHYLKYKREYEDELTAFLEKVGMLSSAKDRAVLS
ncbi:hypothetical protein Avbf_01000 [Armadillidium vulgare]|nr:hypothetical protein Avbf_01000 [Armadillidium vulgare]